MHYWPSLAIVILTWLLIGLVNANRLKARSFDCFSFFSAMLILQCLLPLTVVAALLSLLGGTVPHLHNYFFDYIYSVVNPFDVFIVTAFLLAFTGSSFVSYIAFGPRKLVPSNVPTWKIEIRRNLLATMLIASIAGYTALMLLQGGGLVEGYQWLARFRNLDPDIDRTFITANAFSLTQTFLLLSVFALASYLDKPKLSLDRVLIWSIPVLFFALISVSRRAIIIPIVLLLFAYLLAGRRIKVERFAMLSLIALATLVIGKNYFTYMADGREDIKGPSKTLSAYVLYTASDLGMTVSESLGSVSLVQLPPRLGQDHLLSILRRFPEESLGFTELFPERIVRLTTEIFTNSDDQDIPPGLMGMMWLDFRWLGPAIYGLVFGIVFASIERIRRKFGQSLTNAALFAIVLFICSTPIITGSLDFVFSVDIFVLGALFAVSLRLRKVCVHPENSCSPPAPLSPNPA